MFNRRLTLASAAALLGLSTASIINVMSIRPIDRADFTAPKRHRTGKTYPHSSKRQRERFARQLAEGKISF